SLGRCLWSFMQMKQIGCSRFLLLVVLFFYFVSRQDVYQINWHLLFQERKLIQMNKSSIYKKFAMLQPGVWSNSLMYLKRYQRALLQKKRNSLQKAMTIVVKRIIF